MRTISRYLWGNPDAVNPLSGMDKPILEKVKYTNFMTDYDDCVPLPEYGMIIFIGDTGTTIGIKFANR